MSRDQRDNDARVSRKCARLEELLRQTLALAGEIADDQGLGRAGSVGQLPGECITIRSNATFSDPAGARNHTICPRTNNFEDIEEEIKVNRCPSAASSSVQEPFSPGTLALSLDAMVEGDSSDGESCSLDNSGPALTPTGSHRLPETTTTKKSSLSSIEEAIEHGVVPAHSPLFRTTPHETPHEGQRLTPPSPTATSTQTPASPQIITECCTVPVRSVSTQSCPLPGSHAPPRQDTYTPEITIGTSPSPNETGGTTRHETAGGADQSPLPPSSWQVRILPIARSPGPAGPASTWPASVKLEAVLPCSFFADGNVAAAAAAAAEASPPARSRQGYYTIMIGRPPPGGGSGVYPGDPRRHLEAVREKSLRDYIGEWDDLAAGTPKAGDARRRTV